MIGPGKSLSSESGLSSNPADGPKMATIRSSFPASLVEILEAGVSPATVLADASYGIDTDFRDGVVGIQSSASLWAAWHGAVAAEALARHWPSTLADPP
jgi:hypothetical protein